MGGTTLIKWEKRECNLSRGQYIEKWLYASLFFFLLVPLSAPAADTLSGLIIPGISVGFITKDTTEEKLRKLLPANQIRRIVFYGEDGLDGCATELFPKSEKAVVIRWDTNNADWLENVVHAEQESSEEITYDKDGAPIPPKKLQKACDEIPDNLVPESVLITHKNRFWHTKSGITSGMSLMELEKVTGSRVIFYNNADEGNGSVLSPNFDYLNLYLEALNPDEEFQRKLDIYTKGERNMRTISSKDLPKKIKSNLAVGRILVELRN